MGTRPEALKLAPVVTALRGTPRQFVTRVCFSGQHGAILRDIAREIGLPPDIDLDEGAPTARTLSESLATLLRRLDDVLAEENPWGVVVQGDTTTALAAALAAFHRGIPVFHVEAGLRTEDPLVPFPEEMNRRLVTRLATLHFAPTTRARDNLVREGVDQSSIDVTGNPIVDAVARFGNGGGRIEGTLLGSFRPEMPLLLVTLHRRENEPHARAIAAEVANLARTHGAGIVWIRHPNPTSQAGVAELEGRADSASVAILPPQPYATFVALMRRARAVLTDSGGVQEEAPVLGVPVVVLRAETDRPEAVAAGNAVVAGADPARIRDACERLLAAEVLRKETSPFGDGHAGERIALRLDAWYAKRAELRALKPSW